MTTGVSNTYSDQAKVYMDFYQRQMNTCIRDDFNVKYLGDADISIRQARANNEDFKQITKLENRLQRLLKKHNKLFP